MRHLFDQYRHHENRLTHGLAVCLNEDRRFLRAWLGWLGIRVPSTLNRLRVVEQNLPGQRELSETESDERGLPDIVIHDNDGWCVFVESKVELRLNQNQLDRHEATLRRRGFNRIHRVAFVKNTLQQSRRAIVRTWSDLYEWLGKTHHRTHWPTDLRSYLEVAEVKMAEEGYLKEGTLTRFDGFHFSERNPYTYGEGKRLLGLACKALRSHPKLIKIGMDPKAEGRSAITGFGQSGVWDFLQLKDRPRGRMHTGYPHLTLGVHQDRLEIALTIPNGVNRAVRRKLASLGPDGLIHLHKEILSRVKRMGVKEAVVFATAAQRHYRTQRSPASVDALIHFRLETSISKRIGLVKPQLDWVRVFAELPRSKQSNIQFQYRIDIPWGTKGLDSRRSLDVIAESWLALEPLLREIRLQTNSL